MRILTGFVLAAALSLPSGAYADNSDSNNNDFMSNPYGMCGRGPVFTFNEARRIEYEKIYGQPCGELDLYNNTWSLMSIFTGRRGYSGGNRESEPLHQHRR